MRRLFSIPLVFFFIASCIGLLLRWHFVSPFTWLKYPYWLHGHSHIMFLGWIFNALMLAFLYSYNLLSDRRYKTLFLFIQLLLTGMLVSFPLQGYGAISIALSALHTLTVWIFALCFFRDMKKRNDPSIWFAKGSLILFVVSSLGILAVGPISASGMGQSKWYYFAVYYYLHFQYNGVFIFGLLSLFLKLLEDRSVLFDHARVHKAGVMLFISLFPTYILSTLWSTPGMTFNIIGMIGAVVQLIFILYFFKEIHRIKVEFRGYTRVLMAVSVTSFVLKSILQLLSAHPEIARIAFEVRPFVIAYLHLVLIGVITFFLLAWYNENKLLQIRLYTLSLLILGFLGSELTMIFGDFLAINSYASVQISGLLCFFSLLLVLGAFIIASGQLFEIKS